MSDREDRRFDVNILPGKAEDLTLAQPRPKGDQVEGFQSVAPDRLDEVASLFGRERPNLAARHPRRGGQAGDVPTDHAPALPLTQRLAQDGSDVGDGPR